MRSRTSYSISSGEVHAWMLKWLLQAKLLKDHGWLCTAAVVLNIVLRAAARSISISAACRDLANGPSDSAVMAPFVFTALQAGSAQYKDLPVARRQARVTSDVHAQNHSWRKHLGVAGEGLVNVEQAALGLDGLEQFALHIVPIGFCERRNSRARKTRFLFPVFWRGQGQVARQRVWRAGLQLNP